MLRSRKEADDLIVLFPAFNNQFPQTRSLITQNKPC